MHEHVLPSDMGYQTGCPQPASDTMSLDEDEAKTILADILLAMEADADWSMDTLDAICNALQCAKGKLYTVDEHGCFTGKIIK